MTGSLLPCGSCQLSGDLGVALFLTALQILTHLRETGTCGDELTDDVRLSCKTISISYEGTLQNGYAILKYCKECVRIPIAIKSLDFLYYPKVERIECPDCLLDLIYAIAMYGSQISDQSQDYILSYPSSKGFDYISLQIEIK